MSFEMSSEMKWSIISDCRRGEQLDKGYSTTLSAPTSLLPHNWNTYGRLQCVTGDRGSLSAESILACLMQIQNSSYNDLFSHTCCMNYVLTPLIFHETTKTQWFNEKCHGWCSKRAFWAFSIAKPESEKISKRSVFILLFCTLCFGSYC